MGSVKKVSTHAKLRVETARARYGWLDVALTTFKRFSDQDGGFFAAALTYFAFFSVFPLVLFSISVLGFVVFLSEEIRRQLVDAGVSAFPLISGIVQPENLKTIEDARFSLAGIALLLVLYSGTGGIVAFEHALNRIYNLTDEGTFIQKRLKALKFLASIGLVALISVALGSLALLVGSPLVRLVPRTGSIIASVLLFACAFKFLPSITRTWREVLPGALIAGAIFEVLKIVGPGYLEAGTEGREETFGAFAAAAGLLVSAYLLCQVALLAAHLNAVLAERRQSREFSLADQKEAP